MRLLAVITLLLAALALSALLATSAPPIEAAAATAPPGAMVEYWDSSLGTVTLVYTLSPNQMVSVTGSWEQPGGVGLCKHKGTVCQGQITSGEYNPGSRTLVYSYLMTWNGMTGTWKSTLSVDGRVFPGVYRHSNNITGAWDLQRPVPTQLLTQLPSPAPSATASPTASPVPQPTRPVPVDDPLQLPATDEAAPPEDIGPGCAALLDYWQQQLADNRQALEDEQTNPDSSVENVARLEALVSDIEGTILAINECWQQGGDCRKLPRFAPD
jgi:hypothetical protein